jgi:PadR family transcriptional regulator PadR
MPPPTDLLPGTLDALILKAVSLQRHHGYGVMMRIQQITDGAFRIEEGALYPALHRLEHQGYLAGEWGVSDNNRRAKYYKLTTAGRKRLAEAMRNWLRLTKAMDLAFNARAEEV